MPDRYPGTGGGLPRPGLGDRYPEGDYNDNRNRDRDRDRDRYPPSGSLYEDERYPLDRDRNRFPGDRDRDRDRDLDRFPLGDRGRYPADRDRYIPVGDRDRYPGPIDRDRPTYDDRYPDRNPVRYPYDDIMPPKDRYADRYPEGSYNDRYPNEGRYPSRDRYPLYRPTSGRYPSIKDNGLPMDLPHTRPYPPDDDVPYRPYLPGGRYPDDRYGGRYPSRYPPIRDSLGGSSPGRDAPDGFPDRRFRPSSYESRYPLSPDSSRGGGPPGRYGSDGRYPSEEILHSARRPEPDSSKRYPPPIAEPAGKYPPTSPNRLPVGTDRYPIEIYKYGNRGGPRPGNINFTKQLIN